MKIVVADIGGTHARFALAELDQDSGDRPIIGPMTRYRSRDFDGLRSAWAAFAKDHGSPLPRFAAIAVAAPMEGEALRFVNNDWLIDRSTLSEDLGLERLVMLNDFGAVAHAVSRLGPEELVPILGAGPLPDPGIISVIGPGTGLGVAILDRRYDRTRIVETEGAHIGFAPLNAEEARLSAWLAHRHGRASLERVISGPGLIEIHNFLGGEGEHVATQAGELWSAAIEGSCPVAVRALDLLTACFGSAAGDLSLAHGSMGVAITGGLANRIVERLRSPIFRARFMAKGRYSERMGRVPVMLSNHPEPGLLGAAIAFERETAAPVRSA